MENETITNDRDFAVTVKYQDAEGNEQETTIEAGQTLEVPQSVAEGVKQQVTAAEAPTEAPAEEPAGEEETEEEPTEEPTETPEAPVETEEAPAATELSKTEREELEKLRSERAENLFSKLLGEGKVVAAQKEQLINLCKTAGVEAVATTFAKAHKVIDFSERGANNVTEPQNEPQEEEKGYTPFKNLSKAQQENLKVLGVSEEKYDEVAKKDPNYFNFSSK